MARGRDRDAAFTRAGSLRQGWIDADGTMGVAMLTLSIGSWLAVWTPMMILLAFPGVLVALPGAIALGARLVRVGNRRGVVIAVLTLNLLHATLLVWACIQAYSGP